ncbi:MAG TPA: hypothetical protein VGJ56_10560 [Reyranella sp.]|jgi:hypothetical protein
MSEPLVVEIWGKPAGIILREGNTFRFHAFARPFSELEGTEFNTLGHARLAAAKLQPPDMHPLTMPQTTPAPNWLS